MRFSDDTEELQKRHTTRRKEKGRTFSGVVLPAEQVTTAADTSGIVSEE